MSTTDLDHVDTIRRLLTPERKRDATAPNLPGVRVVVDGKPAVVYARYAAAIGAAR